MTTARRSSAPSALVAIAILSASLGCRAATPARSARVDAVEAPKRRAVLVSYDGVAGVRLEELLSDPSKLPDGGFRRLAARGFHAVRSVPPTPSLTAVSHVTHVTGALPAGTGIVSNTMLDFARPFPTTRSGFDAPIRAETLWQAARRQGRRVGVMLYPGADGNGPDRTADWMMTWPRIPAVPGRLHRVAAWSPAGGDAPRSYSLARRAVLSYEKTPHSVTFFALDSTDDGRANYDRLLVRSPAGLERQVEEGDWFPVEVPAPDGRTGAWCKILSLAPGLAGTEIYLGPLSRTEGTPVEWVRALDQKVGFWPGVPDDAFGAESDRPEIFLEQVERLVEFLTRANLLAIARSDWDLLLVYHPEVDETAHEFLLVDPSQAGYSTERSRRLLAFVEESYALADRSLAEIERALRPTDSLFVTSDHGMAAIRGTIAINRILADAGVVTLDGDGRTASSSTIAAVPSSGIVHVYGNPAAGAAVETALETAERALRNFRIEGESPFDRILRRRDARELGLDAPESGELIVLAKPGYQFSSRAREGGGAVGPPRSYGGHGYRNAFPEVDATFFAAGPGIGPGRVESIGSWEIAARVASALGIEPPRQAARPPN